MFQKATLEAAKAWASKIKQCQQSGMSAKAWCRKNQVVYTTFIGWRVRLESHPEYNDGVEKTDRIKPLFIELEDKPKTCPGISLECEGIQIRLSADFDPVVLRKCLKVLRGDLC